MKKIVCLITFILSIQIASAKLLDKVALIFDDQSILQSEIDRSKQILNIKKNFEPLVFNDQIEEKERMINVQVIRFKLNELHYNVTDDQVEEKITSNEKRSNTSRAAMIEVLKSQGIYFDEYFEAIREVIEFHTFISKVIVPTIAITDQEVKARYTKMNAEDKRLNYKYSLIDYAIDSNGAKINLNDFQSVVLNYKKNGILPESYKKLSSNELENITEEGLSDEIKNGLSKVAEGQLSLPITIKGQHHIFFVTKKDLVESDSFLEKKEMIRDELFKESISKETLLWINREKANHLIKIL